ncbi:MAG: ComEC/Rec2 family competence protein [Patescibacteria group bacterium]|nr:ComEC/Rec2 family competence protein [Patescibacteria group bacterium]
MAPHLIFFISILSVLSGMVFAGLGLSLWATLIPAAVLFAALFILNADVRVAVMAAVLVMCGSGYYLINDAAYRAQVAAFPHTREIAGMIVTDPSHTADAQSFYLRTESGTVAVTAGAYPLFRYGDTITVEGSFSPPPDSSYGAYLAKEGVAATAQADRITLTSSGGGNPVLRFVFGIKNTLRAQYGRLLAPDQAALLSGITLGINDGFSPAFLQNLSLSGTRHLTAVSGLHMAVMIFVVFGVFAYLFPRTIAFLLTFIAIGFFTALTGFTVSAIRAACLALIASMALIAERTYAPRNALAFAALVIALMNPKVPVFDVGFQLSFLAVLAILYLKPLLSRLARQGSDPGFLGWKDSLAITIAAQIVTAPILITQFQNFSLTAFAANMLVVPMVPAVMVSGLVMAVTAQVLMPVAHLISWVVAPLAGYVIAVVTVSAHLAVLFNPDLGFSGIAAYYIVLFGLIYRFSEPDAQPVAAPEVTALYDR